MKINQDKTPVTLDTSDNLHMDQLEDLAGLLTQGKPNWKLVRERDGLIKHSVDVIWIEFNEDGRGKELHETPAVGLSLIMHPFNIFFTWQTTQITELLECSENYIKFRTKNSDYELIKEEDGLDK